MNMLFAALVAGIALMTGPPPPAFALKAFGAPSQCLVANGAPAQGTRLVLGSCTSPNALWSQDGASFLQSAGTDLCLDVGASPFNGEVPTLQACVDGRPSQAWTLHDSSIGGAPPPRTWTDGNGGRCLTQSGIGAGSVVIVTACNGGNLQLWNGGP